MESQASQFFRVQATKLAACYDEVVAIATVASRSQSKIDPDVCTLLADLEASHKQAPILSARPSGMLRGRWLEIQIFIGGA